MRTSNNVINFAKRSLWSANKMHIHILHIAMWHVQEDTHTHINSEWINKALWKMCWMTSVPVKPPLMLSSNTKALVRCHQASHNGEKIPFATFFEVILTVWEPMSSNNNKNSCWFIFHASTRTILSGELKICSIYIHYLYRRPSDVLPVSPTDVWGLSWHEGVRSPMLTPQMCGL